ncbi:MAG: hypothetical protein C5B47_08960, partial [Verrucomicrobia bacterium]
KNWKFSASDLKERSYWADYMHAYQEMIRNTATPLAPWYVLPSDNKWFARLMVAEVIIETLRSLDLRFPEITPDQMQQLKQARRALETAE